MSCAYVHTYSLIDFEIAKSEGGIHMDLKDKITNIMTFFVCLAVLSSAFMLPADADENTPGTVTTPAFSISCEPVGPAVSSTTSLSPKVTETGKISISVDGLGTTGTGIIQVEKPAGATVRSAYMAAASLWGASAIVNGQVKIDDQNVNWDYFVHGDTYNHWADVTSLVKTKIDNAPAGRVDFTIIEDNSYNIDGTILVVIFDDPAQTADNTIVLLFGAQSPAGDTFNLLLADPVDTNNSGISMDMGVGISFSYQSGSAQYSIIDVNGKRLTSAAGGEDDGQPANGALITVGGLDDSNKNPVDPYQYSSIDPRLDDELYNILPFVKDGDDTITVYTKNPSGDDNIFFAYFDLKSTVAIVGEGIVLGPASTTDPLGNNNTVTAIIQDDAGNPVVSKEVTFEIVSGPHAGLVTTAFTDANGEATFTYLGISEGTDVIVASFINDQQETVSSNEVTKTWVNESNEDPNEIPEFPTIALPIAAIIGLAFIFQSRKEE
ncbi:PEF-CTERM protein sorting domain-containing protein [Methanolobus profundi]|uniref:PEF-CTERM protein sorting domain-containing protein n=2 Tax=Methanolobus profundi TaxID=487685 RepID=A0A1I4RU94_9EURY|nr:PEF-CTERM protein sorting domain-containing protein [Methanolobus profundi]